MYGARSFGGLPFGGIPLFNPIPKHGHVTGAGQRAVARMLIMQEAQRAIAEDFNQRTRNRVLAETVLRTRQTLYQQMERRIAMNQDDDLFVTLAV